MVSHAWGLTWAFWRKGRLYLLTAPLVLASLPTLIFVAFYLEDIWPDRDSVQLQIGSILHLPFLLYGIPYSAFVILWIQGDPRRQYTLPVSTWTLVGASMANGLIWSAGILAVFVGICRAAMGLDWPVWGPILLAATAFACAQAAVWGLNRSTPLRILACAVLVFILPQCVIYRYGTMRWETHAIWDSVTLLDAAVMAVIISVAYVLTVAGVALDRRGEGIHLGGLGRYLPWMSRGTLTEQPPARSATSAQFWHEWRQRGRLLPPCVATFAICIVLWCFSPEGDVRYIYPLIGQCSMLLAFAGWLFGMFLGHRSNLCDMGSFEATRPLTDHQLAMAILKNVALTVATSAALWFGLLAIPVVAYFLAGQGPELFALWEPPGTMTVGDILLATLFFCSLAWTPVALSTTLVLARRWLLHTVILGVPAVAIVGLFVWRWGLPGELQHLASQAILGMLGAVCIFAAPVGFLLGHRLGTTERRLVRRGLGTWAFCAASGLVLTLGFSTLQPSFDSLVLVLSLLAVPIAPFALAPLAVAWNRHR